MPIYDYACQECGHAVELIHRVHESGPAACPRCGGPMRKLIAPPAILFKGSGWAKKDAREARTGRSASKAAGEPGGSTDKPKATDSATADAITPTTGKSSPAGADSRTPASTAEG